VTATNAVGTGGASAASNAVIPATVPGAPTGATATPGNTQASVSWTAPASSGGSPITYYTVRSSPGSFSVQTANGMTTTATVTGLSNGTSYTFTVTATNAVGTGPASAASNAVIPATVPTAPLNVSAIGGMGQATVSWLAPASNGGANISSYTVTSSPGSIQAVVGGSSTTATVTGLTNGASYTFAVTATNAIGTGPASAASNAVTTGVTIRTYYYANGTRIATAVNGVFSYLASDGLGSANVTLGASGNVTANVLYAPFGGVRYASGAASTDYGFTGQHADTVSGLDYYGARYYDPVAGQFTSADSMVPGNGYDIWGLSRYAYVENNPLVRTDPTGHRVLCGDGDCGGLSLGTLVQHIASIAAAALALAHTGGSGSGSSGHGSSPSNPLIGRSHIAFNWILEGGDLGGLWGPRDPLGLGCQCDWCCGRAPKPGPHGPGPGDDRLPPGAPGGPPAPGPGDGTPAPAPGDGTPAPDPGGGSTTPEPGGGSTTPEPGGTAPAPSKLSPIGAPIGQSLGGTVWRTIGQPLGGTIWRPIWQPSSGTIWTPNGGSGWTLIPTTTDLFAVI